MKVFRVIGWQQYKTDCATKIDRVQIAKNADEAIKAATVGFTENMRFSFTAIEIDSLGDPIIELPGTL